MPREEEEVCSVLRSQMRETDFPVKSSTSPHLPLLGLICVLSQVPEVELVYIFLLSTLQCGVL